MTKQSHLIQESSTDFDHEAHSSNLVHLTKERPKSCRRNSSRKNNKANSVAKEIRKQSQVTETENTRLLPPPTSPKPKKIPVKNPPPTVSPKPNPDSYHPENITSNNKSNIFKKKQSLFKLPSFNEIRGKKLRKPEKDADKEKKGDESESCIQLIKYEKDTNDETSVSSTETKDVEVKNYSTNTAKRGGSVRMRITAKENNKTVKRSLSTGRDVRSLREKLESGGNSFRNGISRFGSSARASLRESSKKPTTQGGEHTERLISDDPDENTDLIVQTKREEKEKLESYSVRPSRETTKEKLRFTSNQSVKITPSKPQQPKSPTYKKLNASPGSPRKLDDGDDEDDVFQHQLLKEKPVETYKKLQPSPELPRTSNDDVKFSLNELDEFEEIIKRRNNKIQAGDQEAERPNLESQTLTRTTSETTPSNLSFLSSKNITKDNNKSHQQDTKVNDTFKQENGPEGLVGKHNIVNPLSSLQPQTSDDKNDDRQPIIAKHDQSTPKYGGSRTNDNHHPSALSRSMTWNSYKSMKTDEQEQNDFNCVANDYVKDDRVYTPATVRKSYSIKTYTPNPVRRNIDDQGRILNKRGSAQKNILSALPFFGNKDKAKRQQPPVKEKSDERVAEETEEMQTTDLYESNFKKSNARKTSQDSWLGKSGLFDLETKQQTPLAGKNATTSSQQKIEETEQQHLLQEDWDEDSMLDHSIGKQNHNDRSSNNNNKEDLRNKNEKSKKVKLSGISFKKKYNFEKM